MEQPSGVRTVRPGVIGVLQLQDYGFICLCLQDLCTASLDWVVVLGTAPKKLIDVHGTAVMSNDCQAWSDWGVTITVLLVYLPLRARSLHY
jgi:hypothetical protein